MKNLLAVSLAALSLNAFALTITVQQTSCSLTAQQCSDITDAAKDAANADLPSVSVGGYAEGISNANAFAYKGSTSEYADIIDLMSFKVSGGVAVDGDLSDAESADGIGFGASVTAGINLDILPVSKVGPIDLKKMDLFVTFLNYNLDQSSDSIDSEGELSAFGVFGRYHLIDSRSIAGDYLVKWGGIHLHTGFMRSKMNIEVTNGFSDEEFEDDSGPTTVYGKFTNGQANFEIDSQVTAIPVEVSTYLRLLYVFTLYGGAGFDYMLGKTDIDFSAGGNLQGGIVSADDNDWTGTMSANEGGDGSPQATNFRAFAGVQFNIPFVRLYAQLNKGLGSNLVGTNLGLKIIY